MWGEYCDSRAACLPGRLAGWPGWICSSTRRLAAVWLDRVHCLAGSAAALALAACCWLRVCAVPPCTSDLSSPPVLCPSPAAASATMSSAGQSSSCRRRRGQRQRGMATVEQSEIGRGGALARRGRRRKRGKTSPARPQHSPPACFPPGRRRRCSHAASGCWTPAAPTHSYRLQEACRVHA